MKKAFSWVVLTCILAAGFTACEPRDEDENGTATTVASTAVVPGANGGNGGTGTEDTTNETTEETTGEGEETTDDGTATGDNGNGGNGNGGNGGNGGTPSREPVSVALIDFPYVEDRWLSEGIMGAFEGTPVDLSGTVVEVLYRDGHRELISYDNNPGYFTIWPPIYMLNWATVALDGPGEPGETYGTTGRTNGVNRYWLTFNKGGLVEQFAVTNGLRANPTQIAIGHVQPLIDAHWVAPLTRQDYRVDDAVNIGGAQITGWYGTVGATRIDWHPVNLTPYIELYQWRWVWNNFAQFVGQEPGVLFRIGTWGDFNRTGGTALTGLRMPVRNLYQVEEIDWVTEPAFDGEPIFFDDPLFIGGAFSMRAWEEIILANVELRIEYSGDGATRTIRIDRFADLRTPHWTDGMTADQSWGGQDAQGFHSGIWEIPQLRWLNVAQTGPAASWLIWVGDDAQHIDVRYRLRDTDPVRVPVYTELREIEIVNISDEDPIVMEGRSFVDGRGDREREFLHKIQVNGLYIRIDDNGDEAELERVDLQQAMMDGRMMSGGVGGSLWTNIRPGGARAGNPNLFNTALFNTANSNAFRADPDDDANLVTVIVSVESRRAANDTVVGTLTDTIEVGQLNYTFP
jgi:hypothetical protein